MKGNTTLMKQHVCKVQMELDWERARNNRINQDKTPPPAWMEEKIAKTLQSTQNLEELKKPVTQNL